MIYHRKVIRIRAEDSPNVRLALMQKAMGRKPTGDIVIPGVIDWQEYQNRMLTWDAVRICVGISAEFYEGAELLLFPPEWLNLAERRAEEMGRLHDKRKAKAIGVDPAEGGDKTAIAVIDDLGLLELVSVKTPDTSVTPKMVAAMMRKWDVPPGKVCFDRGGGGKQHADQMNSGKATHLHVRTIGFGESLLLDPIRRKRFLNEKIENRGEKYEYVNRRAQLYHELSLAVDPGLHDLPFALPPSSWGQPYQELRQQLSVIPKEYDEEGRLKLRPKHRKPGQDEQAHKTLTELIGHSPDEADAVALAYHAMTHKGTRAMAGSIG